MITCIYIKYKKETYELPSSRITHLPSIFRYLSSITITSPSSISSSSSWSFKLQSSCSWWMLGAHVVYVGCGIPQNTWQMNVHVGDFGVRDLSVCMNNEGTCRWRGVRDSPTLLQITLLTSDAKCVIPRL